MTNEAFVAIAQQWVCFALIGAHFISDEGSTNPLLPYILVVYFNTGGIFGSQNLQAKYAVDSEASPPNFSANMCSS